MVDQRYRKSRYPINLFIQSFKNNPMPLLNTKATTSPRIPRSPHKIECQIYSTSITSDCLNSFSTWLTAVLTYNPTWAFSMQHPDRQDSECDASAPKERTRRKSHTSKNFTHYKQITKFIISNEECETIDNLQSLVFVTSYFFRSSYSRRKKISKINRLRSDQLKSKKVVMDKQNQSSTRRESDELANGGVLFMLGDNEELVQQGKPKAEDEERQGEIEDPMFYRKVSLPKV